MKNFIKKMDTMYIGAQNKAKNFLVKKNRGISGVIVAIGLALIAFIVVLVFKNQMQPAMESSIKGIADKTVQITNEINSVK